MTRKKPVPPPAPKKLPPPDAAERIRALAAAGWAVRGIARELGTTQDTLRLWYERHPELKEAFEEGREIERRTLHNVVYRAATEGTGKDALLAAFFLLNSRHQYRSDDQAEQQGNRVNVTFNIPAAMPLDKFMTVENEHTDDHAERVPNAPARLARRG